MSARAARQDYTKRWKRARREFEQLVKRARREFEQLVKAEREMARISSSEEGRSVASAPWQCVPGQETLNIQRAGLDARREVTPRTEGGGSAMEMELRAIKTAIFRMAQRMDSMEAKINELLSLARGSQPLPSAPDVEDLLLSPCTTFAELQELEQSLCTPERRNKMLLFLVSLGGTTAGDAIRRMLRRMANNNVLKEYSLRGRMGKKAFQDLTICRVLTTAAQRNFPAIKVAEAEELIGTALKFAPHRRQAEKE